MISRPMVLIGLAVLTFASGCRTPGRSASYGPQSGYATVDEYDVFESSGPQSTPSPTLAPPVPPAPPAYEEDIETGPRIAPYDSAEPLSYFPSGVSRQNRLSGSVDQPPAEASGRLVPHAAGGERFWQRPVNLLKPLGRRIRAPWDWMRARFSRNDSRSPALSKSTSVIKPALPQQARLDSRHPLPVSEVVTGGEPSPFVVMISGEDGITAADRGVYDRSADPDRGQRTWDDANTQENRQLEDFLLESPPVGRPEFPQPLATPAPQLQPPPEM